MLHLIRSVVIGLCIAIGAVALGAQLGLVAPPATAQTADEPASPPAARTEAAYAETTRRDLTSPPTSADYVPESGEGTFHRTEGGVGWWGAGPTDGPPRAVVILMHGSGRDGRSMIDMWHETAMAHDLVLVAPDFEGVAGWAEGVPDPAVADAALVHASTLHPIDPSRIHLFGHSRGAIAAQVWANRMAGPWRAVAVHAGTLPAGAVVPAQSAVPIRHYLGTLDHLFPAAAAREGGEALASAGHPFELVLLAGHTHWFYARGEDIAADAWAWMAGAGG